MRALLLLVLVAAAIPASAQAQTTLYGEISNGDISLRDAGGASVTHLAPGTYTFRIVDRDALHNFHLLGTPVISGADIGATGDYTFTDVVLTHGVYRYQCDVHTSLSGSFTVGNALQVRQAGTASGTVTGTPGNISCGPACTAGFPEPTAVTLTAAPAAGARFDGWSGACSGTGACTVTVSGPTEVTARFTAVGGPVIVDPPHLGRITGVSMRRVRGLRVVHVGLHVDAHADAVAKLTRGARTAGSARAHLMPGRRTMRIRVPRTVRAGGVSLVVTLRSGENRTTLVRSLRLGRP